MVTSVKFWLPLLTLVAIGIGGAWAFQKNDGQNMQRTSSKTESPKPESTKTKQPKAEQPKNKDNAVLKLPRERRSDEELAARVWVGELPARTRIIVRLKSGRVAGTITPYGSNPGRKAGVFTVPIPDDAVVNGTVTLRFEVADRLADHGRPPSDKEVERTELAFLPVTPLDDPEL
jgi:hypothetical protein